MLVVLDELDDAPHASAELLEERQLANVFQSQIQCVGSAVYPEDVREPAMRHDSKVCTPVY